MFPSKIHGQPDDSEKGGKYEKEIEAVRRERERERERGERERRERERERHSDLEETYRKVSGRFSKSKS